jgi:uncharacterized alpha-E superfamily protein
MLSRTALNLYWIGRYVERAEFTARLLEATVRLDSLSPRPAGLGAWSSALSVAAADHDFEETGEALTPPNVARYLTLADDNGSSIRSCLRNARTNARAVRTALSREAWETINRAWTGVRDRSSPGGTQATLNLIDQVKAEARGFEGALHRMLHNEASWFIRLGAAIERADNTARLLDVKYHLLLPDGAEVGGPIDRDQWTTILHTVSAVTAYRWLYREGLQPWLVAELLILRSELPRSLAASAEEIVTVLTSLSRRSGKQGEADRLARSRLTRLRQCKIEPLFQSGLHEYLQDFLNELPSLDQAIAHQFRFA